MTAAAPSFDFRLLDTPAGSLPCIVRGPATGPQLLIVPPLFEEMNRSRALLAGVGRHIATRGVASWLPDLPGTGDSGVALTATSWAAWRSAVAALAEHIALTSGQSVHMLSVRGGALLDDVAPMVSFYRLAPVAAGERLLRELLRTRLAADQERGTPTTLAALEARLREQTAELGGYSITPALAAALRAATAMRVEPLRTAALTGGDADHVLDGPPVWRQAEPVAVPGLAAAIGDDLAAWIMSCVR